MKFSRHLFALGALILGISFSSQADPLARRFISVPVWSIATDTLVSMTPKVAGKRNDVAANALCALSRGEKTVEEIAALGITIDGDLLNASKQAQQASCAAYLATMQFMPVDLTRYVETSQSEAKKGWKLSDLFNNPEPSDTAKPKAESVNQAALINYARLQMATAQATAQLYAVIASNIGNQSQLGWRDYQQQVQLIVSAYAADYLQSIRHYYVALANEPLTIEQATSNSFSVVDTQGHQLIRQQNSVVLRSYGLIWLGEGKILGKEYYVNVNVLGPEPEPAKPAKKKRTR